MSQGLVVSGSRLVNPSMLKCRKGTNRVHRSSPMDKPGEKQPASMDEIRETFVHSHGSNPANSPGPIWKCLSRVGRIGS